MSEFNPVDVGAGRRLSHEPVPAGPVERERGEDGETDSPRREREGLPSHSAAPARRIAPSRAVHVPSTSLIASTDFLASP